MSTYIKVPEQFIRNMQHPLCGVMETKLYLWLCFRRATLAKNTFETSLSTLAADFGLRVKSGVRKGKPDGPRVARALRNLQQIGFIERKRKTTKAEGHRPSRITMVDWPKDPFRPYPAAKDSLNENLPIVNDAAATPMSGQTQVGTAKVKKEIPMSRETQVGTPKVKKETLKGKNPSRLDQSRKSPRQATPQEQITLKPIQSLPRRPLDVDEAPTSRRSAFNAELKPIPPLPLRTV